MWFGQKTLHIISRHLLVKTCSFWLLGPVIFYVSQPCSHIQVSTLLISEDFHAFMSIPKEFPKMRSSVHPLFEYQIALLKWYLHNLFFGFIIVLLLALYISHKLFCFWELPISPFYISYQRFMRSLRTLHTVSFVFQMLSLQLFVLCWIGGSFVFVVWTQLSFAQTDFSVTKYPVYNYSC